MYLSHFWVHSAQPVPRCLSVRLLPGFVKLFGVSRDHRGPQRIMLPPRTKNNWLNSTYLALLGSFGLQNAQNSLIALRIAPLGPLNSKMMSYFKIGQVLADLWPIYSDRKSRII